MNKQNKVAGILQNKFYKSPSVFLPENLLREARRQRNIKECLVPLICVLDPDGDLVSYLLEKNEAKKSECWACYHSSLFTFNLQGVELGILPCIVGSSYAVLVAEQLFVSGCTLLISVTSSGIITHSQSGKRFALITEAIRDEGTSYHYLPPAEKTILPPYLYKKLSQNGAADDCPYFEAKSWTTDAPYRETQNAISAMENENVCCVEMEASALYAFGAVRNKDVVCFAHLTNSMAKNEGDFEKGEHFGSIDTLNLLSYLLNRLL